MAESMKGLKRSHRCTGTEQGKCGHPGYGYGMGTEEKKSGKSDICGLERPFRSFADRV